MDVTLSDMLRNAARRWSHDTAYVYAGMTSTWAETDRRVDALAAALRALGVKAGDVVASLTQDGPVLVELIYAASRIGAVRVGVNYRMSAVEIRTLLDHCQAKVLFVADEYRSLAPKLERLKVLGAGDAQSQLGEYAELLARHDGATVASERYHVSQYCYTTGSTGRPKAAVWTHESMNYAIANTLLQLDFQRDDVWLHCFPAAGTPLILAIWNVYRGFKTVVMPAFEPDRALDLMEEHGVTRVLFVPTMMNACCEAQQKRRRNLNSVRRITYGSAPTPPALIKRSTETFPNASFEQLYGATECCGGFVTRLTAEDHVRALTSHPQILESCGLPMQHSILQVQREDGTPCDVGEVGEIAVRGGHVMQGYLNEPELTANALRNGWLMTGDMGRVDEEGYLYLVDRKQFMIITGGYNVYPIEVENALAAHPSVLEVCVFGVPDERWGEAVHAAVVLRDGAQATPEELIEWSRGQLAKFKVPKSIELRDALIRGGTGKIQKRAERDRYIAMKR